MSRPSHNRSIEEEPHLRSVVHEVDPTEAKAERLLAGEATRANIDDVVQHTVWDEPALSAALVGPADGPRLTYAEWLDWRIATTPVARTWLVTLAIVLAAGPWGVLGALFESMTAGAWGLIAVTVIAPVVEETMKVAIALWVIEKRPYLFRMPVQILLCALAGGLAFAFIENLMYLNVTIPGYVETQGLETQGSEPPSPFPRRYPPIWPDGAGPSARACTRPVLSLPVSAWSACGRMPPATAPDPRSPTPPR